MSLFVVFAKIAHPCKTTTISISDYKRCSRAERVGRPTLVVLRRAGPEALSAAGGFLCLTVYSIVGV